MNNKLDRLYRRVVRQFRVMALQGHCRIKNNEKTGGITVDIPIERLDAFPLLVGGGGRDG